jgi:hypothetical protein
VPNLFPMVKKVEKKTMTVIVIVIMIAMHAKRTSTSPSFASVPISKTVLSLLEQELVVSAVPIPSQLMLPQSAMYQFQILLPSTRQPPTPVDLRWATKRAAAKKRSISASTSMVRSTFANASAPMAARENANAVTDATQRLLHLLPKLEPPE